MFLCLFFLSVFTCVSHIVLDILYLNKQRLKAVKELNEANREKQLLVDKIEQLEKENRRAGGKGDSTLNLAYCSCNS